MRDKIAVLEQLIRSGGHTQLILAGDSNITGRIRHTLPNVTTTPSRDFKPKTTIGKASTNDNNSNVIP